MPINAGKFVIALSKDPALQDRFLRDPDAVMKEHGLSDEDRTVINSRDPEKIKAYLGDDGPVACLLIIGWED